jgi:hypothetical protein
MPTGGSQVPDPNGPDAFAVIADRNGGDGLYTSNAQVVVYKLVGDFDPREAITHGFVDSQQLASWQTTDGSLRRPATPSSVIEVPPAERHGAQHVLPARHRHRRPGPLPGDAVGDQPADPVAAARRRTRSSTVRVAAPAAPVTPAAAWPCSSPAPGRYRSGRPAAPVAPRAPAPILVDHPAPGRSS